MSSSNENPTTMSHKTQTKDARPKRSRQETDRFGIRDGDLGNDEEFHAADEEAAIVNTETSDNATTSDAVDLSQLSVLSP